MDKLLEKFTKQRIREVGDIKSLSESALDHLEPALKEIIKGNVHSFIVAVETADGIIFCSKYRPSPSLMEKIIED